MGLSKSTRIQILLGIDTVFFLLELTVGYAVHSLALVADSFHMLNDVISLCVGLWAVKVAGRTTNSKTYTYGWQRAETLGALINGVFLVALCLSIFLEAIQRFVEPQEVSRPQLVLVVGCFGLASNIVGLFLFHDHGHGSGAHGGHHGHGHADQLGAAEEGRSGHDDYDEDDLVRDERGNIADVLPQQRVRAWSPSRPKDIDQKHSYGTTGRTADHSSETAIPSSPLASRRERHKHGVSRSRGYSGLEDIHVHPASLRKDVIRAAQPDGDVSDFSSDNDEPEEAIIEEDDATEQSPLLDHTKGTSGEPAKNPKGLATNGHAHPHGKHHHNESKKSTKKSGHSHSDLNMRGVFLHVMGDALGNIGVIATALFIWLTSFSWRFYTDPGISLVITMIILASAIPLCKAASRILLQAVPAGINVDDIKDDIKQLPGIISCHHLHVWQLSDTKLVASLHVQVGFDFKGEGAARYMDLAKDMRSCLHDYGIHSSTIQPEFCLSTVASIPPCHEDSRSEPGQPSGAGSKAGSVMHEDSCLLECSNECGTTSLCCAPARSDEEDNHQP